MRAARLHAVGEPMRIDVIDVPDPGPGDVLVRVEAVGVVPNLGNILNNWSTWFPQNPLPDLPSIFGLDPVGVVVRLGRDVENVRIGQRVYVNPARYCGACRACKRQDHINCESYAFAGYFGFTARSPALQRRYGGGLAELMTAPAYALVPLDDQVTFGQAARFGYLGTMYAAMRKAGVGPDTSLLVTGISGTLGLAAAILAPAFGVTRLYGVARNPHTLERVRALDPRTTRVHSVDDGRVSEWINLETKGRGVDVYIDAVGPGAPHDVFYDAMHCLARGGVCMNIGALAGDAPVDVHHLMDQQHSLIGSVWFTSGEAQEMAELAAAGRIDLNVYHQIRYPLDQVNTAISGFGQTTGFDSVIVEPQR